MRILAIRGRNLASLARSFSVELASGELANVGLFAITGPVGAGKSTLLDALCLALFDRTPRLKGRGGTLIGDDGQDPGDWLRANDPRTLLRRNAVDGHAEVDFVGRDGVPYRSRWSVRRARRKADGRLQDQELVLEDLRQGTMVAGGRKVEVLAAIQQRLGLDFEQFCRSVLLAQGEFHAFLHAAAQERAKLLETLTGAQLYRRLSRAAHQKRSEHDKLVEMLRDRTKQCVVLEPDARKKLKGDVEQLTHQVAICDIGISKAQQYVLWHQAAEQHRLAEDQATQKLRRAVANNDAAESRRTALRVRQRALAAVPRWEVAQQVRAKLAEARQAVRSAKATHDAAEKVAAETRDQLAKLAASHFGELGSMPAIVRELPRWQMALERWQQTEQRLRDAEQLLPAMEREVAGCEQEQVLLRSQAGAKEGAVAVATTAFEAAEHSAAEADYHQVAAKRRELTEERAKLLHAASALQLWQRAEQVCDKQRARVAAIEREAAPLQKLCAATEARVGYAEERRKEALLRLRTAEREQGLVALRSQLVAGEACPLCGSAEHPAAVGHDAEDLAALRQGLEQAEAAHAEAQSRQAAAKVDWSRAQVDAKSQQAELQADILAVAEELAKCQTAMVGFGDQTVAAFDGLGSADKVQQCLEVRQARWASADGDLAILERAAASRSEQLRGAREARTKAEQALSKWREALASLEQVHRKAADALQSAVAQVGSAQDVVRELVASLADACEGLPQGAEAIAAIGAERLPVLTSLHHQDRALEQAIAEAKEVGVLVREHQRIEASADKDHEVTELAFATALSVSEVCEDDVATVHRLGPEALMEESDALQALTDAVKAARTELQLRAKLRREHDDHDRPTLDADDALAALRDAQQQREVVDRQRVQASGQVTLDDSMLKRRAELAPELARAEQEFDVWCALHDLIGSSTGDSFAVFAQALTLDLLLLEANRRLEELARRYRLEKSKGGELDFVVVDLDMGGTRRSLHTLSGGETFLVSLALALALATLAAPRSRVETLFLDEGFGTLDAQNLEIALGALDSLQASGCQVGVISHVEGIAERIGAVVEVQPEGSGQSRVVARSV